MRQSTACSLWMLAISQAKWPGQ